MNPQEKRIKEESVLTSDKEVAVEMPTLTDDEKKQADAIKSRLLSAQMQRNQPYPEFGNRTYLQRFEDNRNKAHTILPAGKKNEQDVTYSAGTLEAKLEAVLSAVNNLNLSPTVKAFDKDNFKVSLAGTALEDAISMTEELDEDEEKKLLRQKEMLIQGEVFVEERWVKRFKLSKKLNKKNYNGEIKGVDWSTKLEKVFEGPSRTVKYGPNVYLGDITQFEMKLQPYIALVEVKSYTEAEAIFGKWERWQHVSKKLQPINIEQPGTQTIAQSEKTWTMNAVGADQVEIAVYQDKWNDELQIMLNGVPMLPVGFPLSYMSANGEYTIEKQVLKPYDNFAYGRGFIQSVEKAAELLDEMLKLMVLKTRKSFMPPYLNTGKKYISPRVLMPGNISMGIAAEALQAVGQESEGFTNAEFMATKELSERIDRQTVSPQFTGNQGKSGTTATEVMELQKQAKLTLGLIITAASLLEKKIGYLRLYNILENWYKPIQKVVLSDRNQYRITTRETDIEGSGRGERQVIPMDGEIPDPTSIRIMEMNEEKLKGYPVQKIFMNPEEMKKNIEQWYIIVNPKEKDTTMTDKLMFREELIDLSNMQATFGTKVVPGAIESEYARVFKKDKSKLFSQDSGVAPMMPAGGGVDPNQMKAPGAVKDIPTMDNIKLA